MKYIRQFSIIIGISFAGELCNRVIPLPIPGSIYGLVILFAGLSFGIIRLADVKETGIFLIEIMPLMFIPAAVGLLESFGVLKPVWVPVVGITLITTVIVMVVAGRVTQCVLRFQNGKTEKDCSKRECVEKDCMGRIPEIEQNMDGLSEKKSDSKREVDIHE